MCVRRLERGRMPRLEDTSGEALHPKEPLEDRRPAERHADEERCDNQIVDENLSSRGRETCQVLLRTLKICDARKEQTRPDASQNQRPPERAARLQDLTIHDRRVAFSDESSCIVFTPTGRRNTASETTEKRGQSQAKRRWDIGSAPERTCHEHNKGVHQHDPGIRS